MAQGAGMVFSWKATSDVAVDMHGERPDVKGPGPATPLKAPSVRPRERSLLPLKVPMGGTGRTAAAPP